MVTVSLVLLALTLLVIAAGLHLGPHSSVGAGVSSFVVAGVAVAVLASNSTSITTLTILIYALIFLISLGTIGLGLKGVLAKPRTSSPQRYKSLLGRTGIASTDLAPSGTVTVDGESWSADALDGVISKGANIFVVEADRIHLKVAIDTLKISPSTSIELNESIDKENKNGKDDH